MSPRSSNRTSSRRSRPSSHAYYQHDQGSDGFLPARQAAEQQGVTVDELAKMVERGWLSAR